jgi:hypothetical protein
MLLPPCCYHQDMTYVKQLEDYEEAVMARRLAEMPPDELDRLMTEVHHGTPTAANPYRSLPLPFTAAYPLLQPTLYCSLPFTAAYPYRSSTLYP